MGCKIKPKTPTHIFVQMSDLRYVRLHIARSFFLLQPDEKMRLAISLGDLIVSSPLEALIIPGDRNSENANAFELGHMTFVLQVGNK